MTARAVPADLAPVGSCITEQDLPLRLSLLLENIARPVGLGFKSYFWVSKKVSGWDNSLIDPEICFKVHKNPKKKVPSAWQFNVLWAQVP